MTGIEKLRDYAGKLKDTNRYDTIGMRIEEIADQIEREARDQEPPDSWERIEEDARKNICDYFDSKWMHCDDCKADVEHCASDMALDIFQRCRALAEKEAGR